VTDIHLSIYDIAPSVAITIHRRYRHFVELDDVRQECYRWAAERANYINEQLSEENTEQRRHNEQKIAWQMRRAAERYARKEKATKSGYQVGDEAFYETFTLAQVLPFIIASIIDNTVLEQAQEMIQDGMPKGTSSPSEGGNLLISLIDAKKAYLTLDSETQQILTWRYHQGLTLAQIAHLLECAVSTADRKCVTALRKLQNELGGNSPWS
jgi:DNA-directed RNA polymerase specialized sigma24 family protein